MDLVAHRAQDDTMLPAHDFVDLNGGVSTQVDPTRADGTPLAIGDVVRLTYDPGYYVDANVTRIETRDGSDIPIVWARCIDGTYRHTFCASVDWAVHLTLRQQRILLPGETAGSTTDPYARPLAHTALVQEFLTRAATLDADLRELLLSGVTLGDVHRVESTRGLARTGTELEVARGLMAVLDDRPDLLEEQMRWLRERTRPGHEGGVGDRD